MTHPSRYEHDAGGDVTAAPGGNTLVFRRRRRLAVESLALGAALTLLTVLAGFVIVGSGPVDYLACGWLAATAAGTTVVLLVPLFVLRLALDRRISVALTPDGIVTGLPGPDRIAWADVVRLGTVWRLAGRQVLLKRRSGPAVRLDAPRGSGWLPDPTFGRELAGFREWATRHGASVEVGGQGRRWSAVVIALVVLAVLTAAGVRAADRGVIWPSTPTASRVTAACPALQAAGLDRVWPAATRTLERDEQDRLDLGEYSYCWWVRRPGRAQDAPYLRLSAVVRRHRAFAQSSPITMAVNSYTSDRAAQSSPEPVPGLGDDAFARSADDEVLVAARRANITVAIDIDLDLRHRQEAEAAARALVAAILADIRLDGEQSR
jgi:hypothetical protein